MFSRPFRCVLLGVCEREESRQSVNAARDLQSVEDHAQIVAHERVSRCMNRICRSDLVNGKVTDRNARTIESPCVRVRALHGEDAR